jgi:hypothetical protein
MATNRNLATARGTVRVGGGVGTSARYLRQISPPDRAPRRRLPP